MTLHSRVTSDKGIMSTLRGCLLARLALWLLTLALFPIPPQCWPQSFQVEVLHCYEIGKSSGALQRSADSSCSLFRAAAHPETGGPETLAEVDATGHVLAYLEKAERKESDPWLRDDIRIAWITTLYASQGNPQPHIDATYRVLGLHPDQVWPAICARRERMLGVEYANFFPQASSPKKPCASVRDARGRRRA